MIEEASSPCHELFNELEAEPVFAALRHWLDQRSAEAERRLSNHWRSDSPTRQPDQRDASAPPAPTVEIRRLACVVTSTPEANINASVASTASWRACAVALIGRIGRERRSSCRQEATPSRHSATMVAQLDMSATAIHRGWRQPLRKAAAANQVAVASEHADHMPFEHQRGI